MTISRAPMGNAVRVLSAPAATDFPTEWFDIATENFWMKWRLASFLHQMARIGIRLHEPMRGLDVGSGPGIFRKQVERSSAWIVDGADVDPAAFTGREFQRGENLVYDVHDRRPDMTQRYDFVVLFDVLEHISDTENFLASTLHHVKPGGWLFVNVPALSMLFSAYDRAAGHLRRYNRRTMRQELAPHPVEICDSRYWGFSLIPALVMRSLFTSSRTPRLEILRRGFQPPNERVDALLTMVMRLETAVLRRPWAGTSLMTAARRES